MYALQDVLCSGSFRPGEWGEQEKQSAIGPEPD